MTAASQKLSSLWILGLVLVSAFVLGFVAHRVVGNRTHDDSQDAAGESPIPLSTAQRDLQTFPDIGGDPTGLPEQALAAWNKHNRLDAAVAFYRWLHLVDAAVIEARLAQWTGNEVRVPLLFTQTAYARWAQLDPVRLAQLHGDDRAAQQALWIARLRDDPDTSLTDCPKEVRVDCLRYRAAHHPSFDLDWARSIGISAAWYVQMWLRRGIRPDDLLANADSLDEEIVQSIFSFVSSRTIGEGQSALHLARLMQALQDPSLRDAARKGIAQAADANTRPLETLKLLHALDVSMAQHPQRSSLYQKALSERPDDTIDWLLALEPNERKTALRGIFSGGLSGHTDTLGWTELYLRLPREELPSLQRLELYFNREPADSAAVLSWFEEMADRNHFVPGNDEDFERTMFLTMARGFGGQLALRDFDAAVDQARQIQDQQVRRALLTGLGTAAAAFDLEAARSLLPDLDDAERDDLSAAIFTAEFKAMPLENAIETLASVPDADERAALTNALVFDASVAPQHRAAVLDATRGEFPALFGSTLGLVIQWASEAPEDAAAWIEQYADHPRYPRNATRLVETWARHDIVGAAHWILEHDPGPVRDRAIEVIAEEAIDRAPHSALEWAASLSDPEKRLEHLQSAILSVDRNATRENEAANALASLDLAEAERAALMQHLDQAP